MTEEQRGRRAGGVTVYGVDERFWTFQGVTLEGGPLSTRQALLSPSLAEELGAGNGASVLLRVQQAASIPGASLFGRRDDLGKTVRLTVRGPALSEANGGEFSLRPSQQAARAVFLPLRLLQRTLEREGKVNTLLLAESEARRGDREAAGAAADLLGEAVSLADLGLRVRPLPDGRSLSLESDTALLDDALLARARAVAGDSGFHSVPILTYLANAIRGKGGRIPYSLVTAVEWGETPLGLSLPAVGANATPPPIVLNDWAARDLGAKVGDAIDLEYYLWLEEGRLVTHTTEFRLAGTIPLAGPAGDRDFAPEYPGITTSAHLSDWDPPFPLDLSLVRPRDEEYWERHRTAPKAFVPLAAGQALWGHRLGRVTSLRLIAEGTADPAERDKRAAAFAAALRSTLDPAAVGLTVVPVRAEGRAASSGATDFGEYFLYFSAFLMWSALLLAALFFRLGVEQRQREIGPAARGRVHALRGATSVPAEGAVLAIAGSVLGAGGAALYAGGLIFGLRTFWVEAVGTRRLELHVPAGTLLLGVGAGVAVALACIALTLRGLDRWSVRGLLAGASGESRVGGPRPWVKRLAVFSSVAAALLILLSARGAMSETGGFFGAGLLLLTGGLAAEALWLSRRPAGAVNSLGSPTSGYGTRPIAPGAALVHRPHRVGDLHRGGGGCLPAGRTRAGGGSTFGDGRLRAVRRSAAPGPPRPQHPRRAGGVEPRRERRGTTPGTRFARFRLRPGEDASCLNLYRPSNPRILGAPPRVHAREGRFSFQDSLASTAEQKANPWLLLDAASSRPEDPIPAIADANSWPTSSTASSGRSS